MARELSTYQHIDHSFSLIARLPLELLTYIFYLASCQPLFDCKVSTISPTPIEQLGLVCVRWRNIIYSTPTLWSSTSFLRTSIKSSQFFTLPALPSSPASALKSGALQKLRVHLKNSKRAKLDVELTSRDISAAQALVREAHRWKRLRINPTSHLVTIFKSQEVAEFPALEVVEMLGKASDAFYSAPRLHSAVLGPFETCPTSVSTQMPLLPWTQILRLHLKDFLMQDICYILKQCTALKSIKLSHWLQNGPCGERTANNSLESLTLEAYSPSSSFIGFFQAMRFPHLKSLYFSTENYTGPLLNCGMAEALKDCLGGRHHQTLQLYGVMPSAEQP